MNMNTLPAQPVGIQSTAGAVPVRNEKGEISMKKVKVQRYISGKKPDYAQRASSSDESDNDDFIEQQRPERRYQALPAVITREEESESDKEVDDPRLRRLRIAAQSPARREEHKPEVIDAEPEPSEPSAEERQSDSDSENELDDDEIERRRQLLKAKIMAREAEMEEQAQEEDDDMDAKEESDSSDSEYTDSEEDTGPRIKPVFVRASDRMTVAEREKKAKQQKKEESEARKEKEERRREALKLVEETIRSERGAQGEQKEGNINDVCTDDENDELEYEAWKLREMKRMKRDKEEREAVEKELMSVERLRNMTEEERRADARLNPKTVTNRASKGKYKFLQKYYHRGAFYLDKEDEVFKRDFSGATLDDHFDKTVLPKVMQVKKFGRSGRTKYTHLVDQDTTEFDSPWSSEGATSKINNYRGGMKQVFEKPSAKRSHNV